MHNVLLEHQRTTLFVQTWSESMGATETLSSAELDDQRERRSETMALTRKINYELFMVFREWDKGDSICARGIYNIYLLLLQKNMQSHVSVLLFNEGFCFVYFDNYFTLPCMHERKVELLYFSWLVKQLVRHQSITSENSLWRVKSSPTFVVCE